MRTTFASVLTLLAVASFGCLGSVLRGKYISGVFEDEVITLERVSRQTIGVTLVFLGTQRPKSPYGGIVRVFYRPAAGVNGDCYEKLYESAFANCTPTSPNVFTGCYSTSVNFVAPRVGKSTSPGYVTLSDPTAEDNGEFFVAVKLTDANRPDAFRVGFASLFAGEGLYSQAEPLSMSAPCRPCGDYCGSLREHLLDPETWDVWTPVAPTSPVAPADESEAPARTTPGRTTSGPRGDANETAESFAPAPTLGGGVSTDPPRLASTTTTEETTTVTTQAPPVAGLPLTPTELALVVVGAVAVLISLSLVASCLIRCCLKRRAQRKMMESPLFRHELESLTASSEETKVSLMSEDVVELSGLVSNLDDDGTAGRDDEEGEKRENCGVKGSGPRGGDVEAGKTKARAN